MKGITLTYLKRDTPFTNQEAGNIKTMNRKKHLSYPEKALKTMTPGFTSVDKGFRVATICRQAR